MKGDDNELLRAEGTGPIIGSRCPRPLNVRIFSSSLFVLHFYIRGKEVITSGRCERRLYLSIFVPASGTEERSASQRLRELTLEAEVDDGSPQPPPYPISSSPHDQSIRPCRKSQSRIATNLVDESLFDRFPIP